MSHHGFVQPSTSHEHEQYSYAVDRYCPLVPARCCYELVEYFVREGGRRGASLLRTEGDGERDCEGEGETETERRDREGETES